MAPVACRAELAAMFVFRPMAGDAGARPLHFLVLGRAVARCTFQTFMRARQNKFGLRIMIEHPERPVRRVMA